MKRILPALILLISFVGEEALHAQDVTVERNDKGTYSGRIFKQIKTDLKKHWVNNRAIQCALLKFETGLQVYNGKEAVVLQFKEVTLGEGTDEFGLTYYAPNTVYFGGSTGNEIIAEGNVAVAFVWTGGTPFIIAFEFTAEKYSEAEAGVRRLEELNRDEVKLLEDLFSKGMEWFYNELSPKQGAEKR